MLYYSSTTTSPYIVNASMLYRGEGKNAEITVGFLHQGTHFLLVGCGRGTKWPETVGFTVLERGVVEEDGSYEPIWGKPCSPEELPEIIRSALETHLKWKIGSWKEKTHGQETLLHKLETPTEAE